MDLGKFRKAIAGGIAGAASAGVAAASILALLPPNSNVAALVPYGLAVGGFAVGFLGVYFAPANSLTADQKSAVLVEAVQSAAPVAASGSMLPPTG